MTDQDIRRIKADCLLAIRETEQQLAMVRKAITIVADTLGRLAKRLSTFHDFSPLSAEELKALDGVRLTALLQEQKDVAEKLEQLSKERHELGI
jgi:hypothetical protein